MKTRLSAPPEMLESLRTFVACERLPIEVVSTGDADVEVAKLYPTGSVKKGETKRDSS